MTPLGCPTVSQCPLLAPLGGSSWLSLQPLSEVLRICCETIELRLIQPFDPSRTLATSVYWPLSQEQRPGRQPGGESHAALDDPLLA